MHWLPNTVWDWTYDKNRIAAFTGLSGDALHVHSGMLILVLTSLILRRWPWNWRPWLAVVIAETLNETYDMLQPFYPSDEGNLRASWHDFWLTLLWPTVILILFPLFARWWALLRSADKLPREGADMGPDIGA